MATIASCHLDCSQAYNVLRLRYFTCSQISFSLQFHLNDRNLWRTIGYGSVYTLLLLTPLIKFDKYLPYL